MRCRLKASLWVSLNVKRRKTETETETDNEESAKPKASHHAKRPNPLWHCDVCEVWLRGSMEVRKAHWRTGTYQTGRAG